MTSERVDYLTRGASHQQRLCSFLTHRQDDNVLLMDRFPTADEILQLPCLPLSLATPAQQAGAAAAGNDATTAAAAAAGQLHADSATVAAVAAAAMAAPPAAAIAAAAAQPAAAEAAEEVQLTPVRQPQPLAGLGGSPAAAPVMC